MATSEATGALPDPISKLVKLLAEEQGFTSVEIAETLWLAMQIEPLAEVEPNRLPPPPPPPPPLPPLPPLPLPPLPLPPPSSFTPKANIAAPTPQAGVLPPQVLPVWLADPAMLMDSLAIVRALRPLLQKVAAGVGKRLNEAATVDNIARTRLWLPVLEPEQESWFDIILVVDRGSSMYIWQRLVKDVVRILRCYGAFRDVQVFDLVVRADRSSQDVVELISKPQQPGHRPSELIDQRGRRIVIILSDCAGAYWWDGTLLPMLQDWGKTMSTVVWQMLPAWMWKRTALGRGTAVAISNDIPGVANQRLKARVQERHEPEDAAQRISVPIVTSEVRDLARWSLMLAGDRREVTPGFLLPQHGGTVPRSRGIEEIARDRAQQLRNEESDPDSAFNQSLETIARERVDRFLELSSPQAQRLIMLLAAAPVITLPVVRLIRDAMLHDVQSPLPMAEVFLSGLLLRLPGQENLELERVLQEESEQVQATLDRQNLVQPEANEPEPMQLDSQDLVQYDFAPRVRNVLLAALPAVDTIEVINSVSAAVERRWNRVSSENFRSFLTNPNVEVPEELKGLRSFASVTADILESLGGEYASFARQLRSGIREEPLLEPGQEDGSFPDLEFFEFIDARLDEGSPAFPTFQTEEFTIITFQDGLKPFEFTVATLSRSQKGFLRGSTEWVIQRQQQSAYHFFEPLTITGDVLLELVAIPGGSFLMGSPTDEPNRSDRESPQHEVTVQPFSMGRYPITQLQWQFVATLMPQINQKLKPNPSHYQGRDRPVEKVSWYEAVEFCDRLSIHTGRIYRLPTEAEWEYACRSGTTTPFHFGETITPKLANYSSNFSYNDSPKGENRPETTPVDHFRIANDWGLSDMHGNVLEWCEDHWHVRYEGAPIDGSAWVSEDKHARRIIRGGSESSIPWECRSAFRHSDYPDSAYSGIGFRVVCDAPRSLT